MPTIDDVYRSSSSYLKAADIPHNVKPVVEIESAEMRENKYGEEIKKQVVLSFVGKEKVLGLNVTNARRIAQLLDTSDFTQWVGYRIRLYVDQTEMDGKTYDCIRVFPDLPEQSDEKKESSAVMAAAAGDDAAF